MNKKAKQESLTDIETIGYQMKMVTGLIDRAKQICHETHRALPERIKEYHAGTVGLACLYIVCEQEMNPRFYDEMCRYKSDVEITPEYLKLIVNDLKAQVPTASVRVRPAAEHFLPRMCGELGLTHKVQAKAAKFLPGLQRQETSADSRMLLAVSIMMATVETPLESRTPAEVAETVGVDLVYLSKVYEKLVAQKSKMEKAKGCNGGDADSKDDID